MGVEGLREEAKKIRSASMLVKASLVDDFLDKVIDRMEDQDITLKRLNKRLDRVESESIVLDGGA